MIRRSMMRSQRPSGTLPLVSSRTYCPGCQRFIGWLASLIMGKHGGGCMVNIALGLVGSLAGGFLFRALGTYFEFEHHGILVQTLVAVIGAVIVIAIWNAITGRRPFR